MEYMDRKLPSRPIICLTSQASFPTLTDLPMEKKMADATKSDKELNPKLYARTYEGMEMDSERSIGDDATVFWRILKLVFNNRLRISLAIVGIFAAAFLF